jgi:hypothetical protein
MHYEARSRVITDKGRPLGWCKKMQKCVEIRIVIMYDTSLFSGVFLMYG